MRNADEEQRAELEIRLSEPLGGWHVVGEAAVDDEMSLFLSSTSGI